MYSRGVTSGIENTTAALERMKACSLDCQVEHERTEQNDF